KKKKKQCRERRFRIVHPLLPFPGPRTLRGSDPIGLPPATRVVAVPRWSQEILRSLVPANAPLRPLYRLIPFPGEKGFQFADVNCPADEIRILVPQRVCQSGLLGIDDEGAN
ncbi:unnamed protein product, partial [Ixodes persulcatus]